MSGEYIVLAILNMILVSLDNIKEHLENPLDQVGKDYIKFNVKKFMGSLIQISTKK